MSIIDLHSHTYASDGSLSPSELVSAAVEAGVSQLAITDHDSIEGLGEARKHVEAFDSASDFRLIDGTEISVTHGKDCLHIVGLNIDPTHSGLQAFLKAQQQTRQTRALDMAVKLEKAGVSGAVSAVETMVETQSMICRTHLAQYLLDNKVVNNFNNAFKRYLGKGAKAYVKDQWFGLEDAVAIINQAGGVAVLAHPMRYKMGTNKLKGIVADFSAMGGKALEVCYPNINPAHKNLLVSWCKEFDLLTSQGSDFHSPDKPWARLGKFAPMPEDAEPVWQVWN